MLTSIDFKFVFDCLVPRSSRLTVQFSGNYPAELTTFFTYRKLLLNLVNSSWL